MTEPSALAMMQLEMIFRANCDKVITDKCVLQKLMTAATEVTLPACTAHSIAFNEHHKRLYMRLRLHAWAKSILKKCKEENDSRAAEKKMKKIERNNALQSANVDNFFDNLQF